MTAGQFKSAAPSYVEQARAAWGEELPDWIAALATACDATSQMQTAKEVDLSRSAINKLLKRGYPASTARIEAKVRARLSIETQHEAAAGWGATPPDWIVALAAACDASNQGVVAKKLGYSPAVISQVLRRSYRGNMERVENMVRGEFMGASVECPVNGETKLSTCLVDQKRTPPFASAWRMDVYRACRNGCPNYRGGK